MTVAHSCCVLFLLLNISRVFMASTVDGTPRHGLRDLPCPNAQDILPCVCSVEKEMRMNMDCSRVISEDELAQAFSAFFPVHNFHSLVIKGNRFLKVLRAGDLGSATFREFHVNEGVLEVVEETSLSGSFSTAIDMDFSDNQIRGFPFEHLYAFTELDRLDLQDNDLQEFPHMYAPTLKFLYLINNPLGHLPYIAFKNLPSLTAVFLDNLGIQEIEPDTFAGLEELWVVSLSNNQLTKLPRGAIRVSSSVFQVVLTSNSIHKVDAEAFTGLTDGFLYLDNNTITELEEGVWRPALEANNYLHLEDNPLTCGCDIAWIMLNATLLSLIAPDTTCVDGEVLIDLDPSIYQDLC